MIYVYLDNVHSQQMKENMYKNNNIFMHVSVFIPLF